MNRSKPPASRATKSATSPRASTTWSPPRPRDRPGPGLRSTNLGVRSLMRHKKGSGTDKRRNGDLTPVLGVCLVAAGVWAYANSFDGVFVFDDIPGIVNNPSIRSLWPPAQWLAAPPGSTPSGRPVLNLTLALNYAIGG